MAHLLGLTLLAGHHLWWGVGVLFASHMTVLWGMLAPGSQVLGRVVTAMDTQGRREVFLTLDDGPHPKNTPEILKLLTRRGVRATFFLIGERASRHPELVAAIRAGGHAIGNHTMTHPSGSFWRAMPERIRREIEECDRVLGEETEFFRAPAGLKSWFLHPVLEKMGNGKGKTLMGWSARGFDAVAKDRGKIVGRIRKRLKPGAIILMHEAWVGGEEKRGFSAAELLEEVLDAVEEEGYLVGVMGC